MKGQELWLFVRAHRFSYGAAMTFARGLPILCLLVASVLLPADAFGRISVVVTALATASLLSDSGMDAAATWLLGRDDRKASQLQTVSALLFVRVCVSVLAVVILVAPQIGALAAGNSKLLLLLTCIAASAAMAYCAALRISLRVAGSGEVRALLLEKIVGGTVFLAVIVMYGEELAGKAWMYPAACLLACMFVLAAHRLTLSRFGHRVVLELLRSAAPFILTTICAALVWRGPVFLLGSSGDYASAGWIALASYPILLLSSISVLSAPILFLRKKGNTGSSDSLTSTIAMGVGCTLLIWLGCGLINWLRVPLPVDGEVIVILALFAPVLVPLWLNPQISAWLRINVALWSPTFPAILGACVAGFILSLSLGLERVNAAVVSIVAAEYASLGFYVLLKARSARKNQAEP